MFRKTRCNLITALSAIAAFCLVCSVGAPVALPKPPKIVTMDRIMKDPLAFNGRRIKFRGRAVQGSLRYVIRRGKIGPEISGPGKTCLAIKCHKSRPCCRGCGSPVSLNDGSRVGGLLTLVGKKLGCGGTNCGMTCNPKAGLRYEVIGVVSMQKAGRTYINLKVESIRRLESGDKRPAK